MAAASTDAPTTSNYHFQTDSKKREEMMKIAMYQFPPQVPPVCRRFLKKIMKDIVLKFPPQVDQLLQLLLALSQFSQFMPICVKFDAGNKYHIILNLYLSL